MAAERNVIRTTQLVNSLKMQKVCGKKSYSCANNEKLTIHFLWQKKEETLNSTRLNFYEQLHHKIEIKYVWDLD